ncbi:MAG: pentapeptide repeat-containing protein [Oligoflexia bacterium]|nr:pentapeptide repeat-containing protein [Oligoflexia bacterium]MBF0365905.1 pentapeptide repeat-containing protein [Oligoflexia bacterium]
MKKLLTLVTLVCWSNFLVATESNGDLMDKAFEGLDLRGSNFIGNVCYHSFFNNTNLSNSQFKFSTVIRFCNFQGGVADGTLFDGWFYHQHFEGTSLKKATFYIRQNSVAGGHIPSDIYFNKCDLEGAIIYAEDMSKIKFQQTNLSGAIINGKMCAEGSLDICH